MELGGEQVVAGDGGAKGDAVNAGSNGAFRVIGQAMIGMDEVEERFLGNSGPQGMRTVLSHPIPTHVGYLERHGGVVGIGHGFIEGDDLAGKQVQSRVDTEFMSFAKQELHADANTQKWFARLDVLQDGFDQLRFFQVVTAIAKGAHAGQEDAVGLADIFRALADQHPTPRFFQGFGDRTQIARSIVNHGDHSDRVPLVLGISLARLASRAQP